MTKASRDKNKNELPGTASFTLGWLTCLAQVASDPVGASPGLALARRLPADQRRRMNAALTKIATEVERTVRDGHELQPFALPED